MKKILIQSLPIIATLYSVLLGAQNIEADKPYQYPHSLQKGNFVLSIGANLFSYLDKNQDQFIYYALEETSRYFNIKTGLSYTLSDGKQLGVAFRYKRSYTHTKYENSASDTVEYIDNLDSYTANVFYGITKPIFQSQRYFLISDPGISFERSVSNDERLFDNQISYNTKKTTAVAIGLNVGVLVLLSKKMSLQATVGPVGIGYRFDDFSTNDIDSGNNESFFIRMSPSILNFEFSVSRYF